MHLHIYVVFQGTSNKVAVYHQVRTDSKSTTLHSYMAGPSSYEVKTANNNESIPSTSTLSRKSNIDIDNDDDVNNNNDINNINVDIQMEDADDG